MQARLHVPLHALLAATLALPAVSQAQTGLQAERIITGVSNVTWVGSPPTDDRIFVTEQNNADVRIFTSDGTPIGTFLDLTAKVQTGGERGLLSLAFDPGYASNGHFYVYYTNAGVGSRIERYTVLGAPSTSNVADPASGLTILEQPQPQSNHNGGNLQFGPDGFLYFAFGDGGGAGDAACNAQKGTTLLGKMIRIDVTVDDFPADPARNYGIPGDNPFTGVPGVLDEIYHLGLRNPWRWSFDQHTGDMYIGDVGQDAREEVDFGPAGAGGLNFGWKIMEGSNCFGTGGCVAPFPLCNDPALVLPIHEYVHSGLFGGPCTVIGGVVYRGCAIPEEYGTYFFAEYCEDKIWTLQYDPVGGVSAFQDRTAELTPATGPIDSIRTFGHDFHGEVLIGDQNEVFRVLADARSFLPDVCDISVSAGGAQTWTLDVGIGAAGAFYFVGGSLTGIAGIPAGAAVVPLTLDAYTLYTLAHPNVPPLSSTFAQLDGAGQATAGFSIGGGLLPPSLIGTQAFHAFATLDAFFSPDFASNPVSLRFLP